MFLEDYRTLNKLTYEKLAQHLGFSNSTVALRYCNGSRFPSPNALIKIEDKTRAAVTANDFVAKMREMNGQKEI
tara:strand:- start:747 stop:968 length:222 start_codon:yes stop_codon:yes gene_type:complete